MPVLAGGLILALVLLTQEPKWRWWILAGFVLVAILAFASSYQDWSGAPDGITALDARQTGVDLAGAILVTLIFLGLVRLYRAPKATS